MGNLKFSRLFLYGFLIIAAIYTLIPLYVMLSTSLKTAEELRVGNLLSIPMSPSLDAWSKAWSSGCTGVRCDGLKPFFWNSLIVTVPAVLISTMLGALNGYVFTQWKFKGSEFIFTALLIGCFIPFQVVLLPMARVLGMAGMASSAWGLIFVHVVYGMAFTTLFFRNYYVSIPADLIKAARVDGAGFWTIFNRILMPISLPIFMVCIIWQFTQIWNDFLFGVVFSGADSQPVTVALNNLVNTTTGVKEYNVDMAAALIAAAPTLLVYMLAGKYFVRGLTAGAVKG
jgi:glucose/mannose transport system permease protein